MSDSSRPRSGRRPAAPLPSTGLPAEPVPITPTPDPAVLPSVPDDEDPGGVPPEPSPRLSSPRPGRRLVAADQQRRAEFTPQQRLLILDAWQRSGLPARDFAPLVGLSRHTLYAWKQRFDQHGPAGLLDQPKGAPAGSRLPELTKRTILLLKQAHPDWGCQRISD